MDPATERMWAADTASRALGMELVEVGPGHAVVRMVVRPDMVNGHGIGHGGLTFALADTAFAFACNSGRPVTVAAGAEVRFRLPTYAGDVLVAEACEVERTGRDGTYEVTVTRGEDVVATFTGQARELPGSG